MKVQYALNETGPVVCLNSGAKMSAPGKVEAAEWPAAKGAILKHYADKSEELKAKAVDVIRRTERKIKSAETNAAQAAKATASAKKSEGEDGGDAPSRRPNLPGAGRRGEDKAPEATAEKD